MSGIRRYLEFIGNVGLFALRSARRAFIPPFEFMMIWRQIESVGWQSLPLVISSGLAPGIVLNFYTRSTMIRFGAQAMIPTVQSLAFFNELGPLVAGLLVAGRGGGGRGAGLGGRGGGG